MTLTLSVVIGILLALLFWFLIQPSSPSSPARQVKNGVFGKKITQAVEQALESRQQAQRQSQSRSQARSAAQGESPQQAEGGSQSEQTGQAGETERGGQRGSRGQNDENANGRRRDRTGPWEGGGAGNEQLPDQAPSADRPAERSIGWLGRFFGDQQPAGPARPGEGGTSENQSSAGGTNLSARAPTNDVAANEGGTAPNQPVPLDPDNARPRPASTNAAPGRPAVLTDNLEQLLVVHRAGSGDIRISLMWNNHNDLDLHVVDPRGEELNYSHATSASGGRLDIDMNRQPPFRSPAVENVYWPERGAPTGVYRVYVNHYAVNGLQDATDFTVRILIRGQTSDYRGRIRGRTPRQLVHQFNF